MNSKWKSLTCFVLKLLRVAGQLCTAYFDWLLTPPGTPLSPSSEGSESKPTSVAPRSKFFGLDQLLLPRRFLGFTIMRVTIPQDQLEAVQSSSILNTSSASVFICILDPSSPITRTPPVARPSTPPARPTPSRSSTPSRVRPASTSSSVDKTPPSQNSRPSTPRGKSPANFSAAPTRSHSGPSTSYTSETSTFLICCIKSFNFCWSCSLNMVAFPGPASRPSSPSPRVRPPQQPVIPPDFPLDTPPNLRNNFAGEATFCRTGVSSAMKGNPETMGSLNAPRRNSSTIVTRERLTEASGKGRVHSNGHVADTPEPRKVSHVSEVGIRRPLPSDSTGFGRTISKKSLDMAIRHMEALDHFQAPPLFPQSIRITTPKAQSVFPFSGARKNPSTTEFHETEMFWMMKPTFSRAAEIGHEANDGRFSAKMSDVLTSMKSSRYDAILLRT
ncbi:LOW QUALITY PROTEIN: hypothetical protein NC653_015157 [Populus alba x Populus x berolinensis]|uniref:Uncharacterized protein n=1 Tax=Populus alba x Populus x berolinensis TaxID=444605 RepID=A0AAD6QJY4_9ROSI|nr:LOW QUALITY PROTEIN: hypothetical protein NC653_015157 [Populus alba x Populus x berolinensis]